MVEQGFGVFEAETQQGAQALLCCLLKMTRQKKTHSKYYNILIEI